MSIMIQQFKPLDELRKGYLDPLQVSFGRWHLLMMNQQAKHRPITGILGPSGVFPEFRRLRL